VRAGVRVSAQSYVEEIEPGQVRLASIWGAGESRTVAANTVVLCMLRRSQDELLGALAQRGIAATRIGDCLAPRDVDDAVFEGMQAGLAPATGRQAAEPLGAGSVGS
jgi:hypothetical protein